MNSPVCGAASIAPLWPVEGIAGGAPGRERSSGVRAQLTEPPAPGRLDEPVGLSTTPVLVAAELLLGLGAQARRLVGGLAAGRDHDPVGLAGGGCRDLRFRGVRLGEGALAAIPRLPAGRLRLRHRTNANVPVA